MSGVIRRAGSTSVVLYVEITRAVVSVMLKGEYKSYWSETASYEAIVPFINMNYDGLKTAIIEMLSGSSVKLDFGLF